MNSKPDQPSPKTIRPDRLRVALMTAYDPVFGHRFLQALADALPLRHSLRVFLVANRRKDSTTRKRVRNAFRLFSFKGMAKLGIRVILAPLRRRLLHGRFQHHQVEVERVERLNSREFMSGLSQWTPDLIFSVSCPQIFKEPLLSLPRFGCFNIHNGRLPDYRGLFSVFWQLYNGEQAVQVSVHEMTPQIDAGPVVQTASLPFNPQRDNLWGMMLRAKDEDARLLLEFVNRVAAGNQPAGAPPRGKGAYRRFPGPDQIKEFKKRGLRTI